MSSEVDKEVMYAEGWMHTVIRDSQCVVLFSCTTEACSSAVK